MTGYSSVNIKKIMKTLEKSLEALPEEQAEDLIRARKGIEALIGIFANIKVEPEAE